MKTEKKIFVVVFGLIILCVIGFVVVQFNHSKNSDITHTNEENAAVSLDINIEDYYITNIGNPSNLYHIDAENILWGVGENQCGQLGNGSRDFEFHEEDVKIAENVIHVDFSNKGFVIYLTNDHKLYGLGNYGCGALQQLNVMDYEIYKNDENYYITTPYLLMEDVIYARCGKEGVVCVTEDYAVWTWGTIGMTHYDPKPVKVLENAVLVTGGWYNYAALLKDGTVWTWGDNLTGNCGVEGEAIVTRPVCVATDVQMVWTGKLFYNSDVTNIEDFEGFYERDLENTIIQKMDGTYYACGVNMGTEIKSIPDYYETTNFEVICTHEFLPYEWPENN